MPARIRAAYAADTSSTRSSISACLRCARASFSPDQLDAMEPYFPLRAGVCGDCFLVQLNEYVRPEHIFNEYAYFSSYSTSWVAHAKAYCEMIAARLGLGADSLVVELASNDGYLLQHFLPLGVPVLGIEPAANVAKVAIDKGIATRVDFFGDAARRGARRRRPQGRPHRRQQRAGAGS